MSALERFVSGGLYTGASPMLRAFLQPQRPNIDVGALSTARSLELAGAEESEIERARQFDRTRGETGVVPVRSVLEGRTTESGEFAGGEDTQPRGLLETAGSFLQRGVSASVGGITGLVGADRRRETAGDGALFETPQGAEQGESNIQLALRRFAEGLSGEEMYRFADFGVLAYDRESTSLGGRAMRSTAGFILDTVVDPLTYMSLGGSLFGRMRGAQRVFAVSNSKSREAVEAALSRLSPEERVGIVARSAETHAMSPSMLAARMREEIAGSVPAGSPLGGRAAKVLSESLDANFADPEFITRVLTASPDFTSRIAADVVAANAAVSYRVGSSAGLRDYFRQEFGDAGQVLFRSMPLDIQGGIRMRVPFSAVGGRDPKLLFRLPGTTGLSAVSNGTRQFLRNRMPVVRGLSHKASGRFGDVDMQLAAAAYASQRNAASKIFGAVDPDSRAIFWSDLETLKNVSRSDVVFNRTVREIVNEWEIGKQHMEAGIAAYARQSNVDEKQAADLFNTALDNIMTARVRDEDGSLSQDALRRAIGDRAPTEAEMEAYSAATIFSGITHRIARELESLFPPESGGRVFTRLEQDGQYWPRMVDYMNDAMGAGQGKGASSSRIFRREQFFSVFDLDGNPRNSMSPTQIRNIYGADAEDALFITDPAEAMLAYMVATTRIIQEERTVQNLLDAGLLVRGQRQFVADVDAARQAAIDVARDISQRAAKLEDVTASDVRRDPQKVLDALAGWRKYDRQLVSTYRQAAVREGEPFTAAYTAADGTRIVSVSRRVAGEVDPQGGWHAQNSQGQFLTRQDGFTRDIKRAARFRTREEAETVLAANRRIIDRRSRITQQRAEEALNEFQRDVVQSLAEFSTLDPLGSGRPVFTAGARPGEWSPNPMHPSNIPLGPKADGYIAELASWANRYGYEMIPERLRTPSLVGQRYRVGARENRLYRELADATSGMQVQEGMQRRFEQEGLFAPSMLVEPIRRMYRARQNPSDFKKFVDAYYRPFYSVQKALMTAQRGPGYVARNVQGGMWNAWLFGVRGRHFTDSSKVNIAKLRAFSDGTRRAREEAAKRGVESITEVETSEYIMMAFQRRLQDSFGAQKGRRMFRAWNTFTAQGMDGRTVSSRTTGTQAIARVGEPDITLQRAINKDIGWYENAADYLAARSAWARFTGRAAQESEDYLRFATYLKGIDDFGLEDGGIAAGLYVKGSQFDYADLSDFEVDVLKMIIPFYTWARNNIPLQLRALMVEPGKVNAALRINDGLRDMFGEPDDEEEPLPAYVRERMGWRIRTDLITGPFGDALAAGVVVGEPLVDVNRLFRLPSGDRRGGLNLRDIANQMNPLFTNAVELITGMEQSTGGRMPRREESPGWMAAFQRPFTEGGEEPTASARALRLVRNTIPPIGIAERLFPQALGNERMQRRWYTSLASSVLGLPVSTLDPFQTAAELRAEENRQSRILEGKFGDDYTEYTGFARHLIQQQVTPFEMQYLKQAMFGGRELEEVDVTELDWTKATDLVRFRRRLRILAASGVDEQRLERMMEVFRPGSDYDRGVRQGRPQPLTVEQLAEAGLTQRDVSEMTEQQRATLINDFFN